MFKKKLAEFDKYYYYMESVQSPETDAAFIRDIYQKVTGNNIPSVLREDFCGTFALCCEWVKLHPENKAVGIDFDNEPLEYGKKNYLNKLDPGQQDRIMLYQQNVLNPDLPKADIIAALNFSYFGFKTRKEMLKYFKNIYNKLSEDGALFLDCFGGSDCQTANEQEIEKDGFSYFWDQDNFDPVTNFGQFYIHIKRSGEPKREKVFSYDWRIWSIPEIKELLEEAGFKRSHVFWEGSDDDGEGNGNFSEVHTGEECESWIAYIVGIR